MSTSKASLWAGRVLTGLSAFGLISSGAMKLSGGAEMMKNWTDIGLLQDLREARLCAGGGGDLIG